MKIILFKNNEKIKVTDEDANFINMQMQEINREKMIAKYDFEKRDFILDKNQNKSISMLINLDEIVCIYKVDNII